MNCTLYNDPLFSYNAPIAYNGVCVSPVPPVVGGGGGMIAGYEPRPIVAFPKLEEEEALALLLAELLTED